jgi:glutathione S-transferase
MSTSRGDFGIKDTPQFLAMNPHGRVPVIDDGGPIVWESQTILRYLAAKCARGRSGRTVVRRTLDGPISGKLQPDFLMGVFWGFYRTQKAKQNLPAIASKVRACARHFQLFDRILADRPFLCGDSLTLADIPAGTSLYRYFEIDIERPSVPNVEAWYRRPQERPAYREHIMIPFGEPYTLRESDAHQGTTNGSAWQRRRYSTFFGG